MLPLAEAFAFADHFEPRLRSETIDITSVSDRHLAEDVRALHSFPNFDHSAMDGYALRVSDTQTATDVSPTRLRVVGESRAGAPFTGRVQSGEAVRIFTGAMIPEDANAVEMQENVSAETDAIQLTKPVRLGQHIRRASEDFSAGDTLLHASQAIGPGEVALLCGQGILQVRVFAAPRVAILCTGSELRKPGEDLAPGQIVNTNGPMLAAAVREAGGIPRLVEPSSDDPEEIHQKLEQALACDLVLTVGGASVGDHDHIPAVFEQAGLTTHFHHVRVKPGKPTAFATRRGTPVFALPGNPVSSFVMFHLFGRPMLRRMLGDPTPYPRLLRARAGASFSRRPGRTEFLRATVHAGGEGLVATPLTKQGSGSLLSLAAVDGFIVISHEQAELERGALVDVWPLRAPGHAIPSRNPRNSLAYLKR